MITFNLKRKWYDLIASGKKNVEYRECKPYWISRFQSLFPGDTIRFRLGYTPGNDLLATVTSMTVGSCPYDGFDGYYYQIGFKLQHP